MATSALQPPRVGASRHAWARVLALAPFAVVLAASLVELALADRKFGLFTGGFGMSRAVDTLPERAAFAAGYASAMALIGLAGWMLALRLTRGRAGWTPVFVFALLNGALFAAVLAARYQLASYFSDAVGFALLRQLGGGSLVDAILFGMSEIGVALLAIGGMAAAAWGVARLLARIMPDTLSRPGAPGGKAAAAACAAFLALAFAIPRSGSDAAYALERTLGWGTLVSALDLASDSDRDGYGLLGTQRDDAPFDGTRHPLALDVPGNGIDEDGYGGDLRLVPLATPPGPQVFTGARPHVVVVVLESVRGDVLGKRVNGRAVAPNLEALAAAGSVARPAYSHVGFTTESLKSLFSGALAPRRGDPSLFTDLEASGYRIGVFSGQPEDFGDISETVAMRSSADVHVDAETLRDKRAFDFAAQGSLLVDEAHLLSAFDRTLWGEDWSGQPRAAYFNFQSAHFPYDHPGVARRVTADPVARKDISAANAERVRETYWNAVAHADRWLGELVARLKAKGVWDETILIVTGDHGEELFEGGFLGHGHVINREQFGTLLVASRPGVVPQGPIGLSDYRAILSAAIRAEAPPRTVAAPFLHIGPLDTPTAIGLAGPDGALTSLRLDTGEACFREQGTCTPYAVLAAADKARVDALVARWGSERWREHQRGQAIGH
ncbi:Sulfatase [Tsuneonella dongtanensis]|uniref:Sulfatase n=1 Tax=Tsuneonella dongtanensis TaxID=692370 RepID=A0A1B2AAC7_9SPHN|nr:sulfatase-like hydrolase/transferase [Tsuneonella dongtanensis]ANY19117.1 Sulfatase [Tsuneonella dongtanensis]